MPRTSGRNLALLGLLVALVLAGVASYELRNAPTESEDIYYSYVEGQRILAGQNPYARVLASDMRQNDKYANYFPVFYELSALSQLAGLRDYAQWIGFWRVIFTASYLAVGSAMFWVLYRRRYYLGAVFAVLFWFFSRWALRILEIAELESVAIFLVIVSLELFKKHRWTSLLLFSLSLGIKHVFVLMIPVYLIWVWQDSSDLRSRARSVLLSGLAIVSVPLVASIPFIVWSPEGFLKSFLFAATRNREGYRAIDGLVTWGGLFSRLPTVALMGLAWLAVWRYRIPRYTSTLLVQASLIAVNPVFFWSYIVWFFPFVSLVLCDLHDGGYRNGPIRAREDNASEKPVTANLGPQDR